MTHPLQGGLRVRCAQGAPPSALTTSLLSLYTPADSPAQLAPRPLPPAEQAQRMAASPGLGSPPLLSEPRQGAPEARSLLQIPGNTHALAASAAQPESGPGSAGSRQQPVLHGQPAAAHAAETPAAQSQTQAGLQPWPQQSAEAPASAAESEWAQRPAEAEQAQRPAAAPAAGGHLRPAGRSTREGTAPRCALSPETRGAQQAAYLE